MTQAIEPADTRPPDKVERIDLPSGGWVEIRALDTLKAKHAKMVTRRTQPPEDRDNPDVVAYAVSAADALIEMMVVAWDLPYGKDWAIPSLCLMRDPDTGCPEVLDEMEAGDYTALEIAIVPAQQKLFPRKVTPDDADKPGSPGEPASA